MSATITWTITAMDCYAKENGNTDVVFNCHWNCAGVDGDYNANIYSTCSVPYSGGSFTPYQNLTQQQVLGWIWANGVDKNATEAAVTQQLELKKNPPVVTPPLPWSA